MLVSDENKIINKRTSYRSIFKATSLFGGVQVYQILVGIVKSKVIAILLGPEGVGLLGLYSSAIDLVKQFTSFGLAQSAVRDVSEASGSGDFQRISKIIIVLRKLVWYTGFLGFTALLFFAPLLSKSTFGNYDYTVPLIFLSVTLLLDQLCAGQKVILQGLRKLKYLAKATVIGSTLGLVVSIPLYYLLGVKGIVPTLILNSITSLLLSYYYSKKIKLSHKEVSLSRKDLFKDGKIMLRMGIAMSISSIFLVLSAYVLRSFIRMHGGIEMVGIFTAGYVLINSYVNMIFTAMGTDFYPRLASVNKDNEKCKVVINQQGEIGTLIMSPLLIICIVFMPFIISLLYSDKFLLAYDYVIFAALGMMFRFSSVLVAHLFLVKSAAKLYIWNESTVCLYTLAFNILGFYYFGMKGLGISFMISYLLYGFQVFLLCAKYYHFSFSQDFIKVFGFQLVLVLICMNVFLFVDHWLKFCIGILIILISSLHSILGLDRRLNIINYLKQKKL